MIQPLRIPSVVLLCAVLAMAPHPARAEKMNLVDVEAYLDLTPSLGVAEAERRIRAEHEDPSGVLAHYYFALALYPEALAVIRTATIEARSASLDALAAMAALQLARNEAALDLLEPHYRAQQGREDARALATIAMAALGAYERAYKIKPIDAAAAPEAFRTAYLLAGLEIAVANKDRDRADRWFKALERTGLGKEDRVTAEYLSALYWLAFVPEDVGKAKRNLRSLAASAGPPVSLRAQAVLARMGSASADKRDTLRAAALRWGDGAAERELLAAIASQAMGADDYTLAVDAWRLLISRHSMSDAAYGAQSLIGAALQAAAGPDSSTPLPVAAGLVLDNLDFAPPGAEGDRLIRDLSARLGELGLFAEAAKLLEHQVFKRLRGLDRAKVAVQLGETYLGADEPAEALRVVRSTRVAGLGDRINAERRAIEARALLALGDYDAGFALVEGHETTGDLALRARAAWALERWPVAANAYAALLRAEDGTNARHSLRAAIAYKLAGDDTGLRALRDGAQKVVQGTPEMTLIERLVDIEGDDPTFSQAYQKAFALATSES